MSNIYHTIENISKSVFKDRNSKFIAIAFPVKTEEEIKEIQKNLRKEYHDARHHCYAWRLGADKLKYRANDDGEPNNSAGIPILNQIQSNNLTNILVVVIRYFGGTKLGIPGLINAYKNATAIAIKNNVIIEKKIQDYFKLVFEYNQMNIVMRLLDELEAEVKEQVFMENCTINFSIYTEKTPILKSKIKLISNSKLEYKKTE